MVKFHWTLHLFSGVRVAFSRRTEATPLEWAVVNSPFITVRPRVLYRVYHLLSDSHSLLDFAAYELGEYSSDAITENNHNKLHDRLDKHSRKTP